MKRYMRIAMLALIVQCGLSNSVYAIKIAPVTLGDDSIVNAIKQYSNLTESDVNQYKLLWLRSLGTPGALLAGAASTLGVGVGTYQKVSMAQVMSPDSASSWMTNPLLLAALGSMSAGYVSYQLLYPRIREGVLAKVQKFIDVCESLKQDSPQHNILTWNFGNFLELKTSYLPQAWSSASDIAVYNALSNLAQQGAIAQLLLHQIGTTDTDINEKSKLIGSYIQVLTHNKTLYEYTLAPIIQRKQQEEHAANQAKLQQQRQAAEIADLEANVGLKQQGAHLARAKTIQTYGEMFTNTVKNTWNGINHLYKNKEKIAYRLGIISAAAYGTYVYAKSRLGFGQ